MAKPKTYAEILPRLDGWANLLTGLGVRNRDSSASTAYAERPPLGYSEQRWLYRQDWACGRVVDDLANDATRAGYNLESKDDSDTAEQVMQAWDDAQVLATMQDGLRWGLVYGGAVGVVLTDDKATTLDPQGVLSMPLVSGTYSKIQRVVIIEKTYAVPDMGLIDLDASSPNYGLPVYYDCTPQLGAGTTAWRVHWTRILRFDGLPVDSLTALANWTYGDSVYERAYNAVRDHGAGVAATAGIVQRFTQGIMTVSGLVSDLVSNQEQKFLNRLRAFNLGLGSSGLGVLDGEHEKFESFGQPVNGLQGLLGELRMELAGGLNYPMARLYGAQAGALASAETDEKQWAATVHAWQKMRVVPPLTRYTDILLGARGAPKLTNWRITPRPIAPPNTKLDAEVHKVNAETDLLYIQGGVLEPTEIRNSRFGAAVYGDNITLDPDITAAVQANKLPAESTEVPTETPTPPAAPDDFGGVA